MSWMKGNFLEVWNVSWKLTDDGKKKGDALALQFDHNFRCLFGSPISQISLDFVSYLFISFFNPRNSRNIIIIKGF